MGAGKFYSFYLRINECTNNQFLKLERFIYHGKVLPPNLLSTDKPFLHSNMLACSCMLNSTYVCSIVHMYVHIYIYIRTYMEPTRIYV